MSTTGDLVIFKRRKPLCSCGMYEGGTHYSGCHVPCKERTATQRTVVMNEIQRTADESDELGLPEAASAMYGLMGRMRELLHA